MDWILKALLGAGAVILIQLLAASKSYYIAGLVPLFPTFTLISHYIVGTQRSEPQFRETILFGMCSMGPYLVYMGVLYCLAGHVKLAWALTGATAAWLAAATALILAWNRF